MKKDEPVMNAKKVLVIGIDGVSYKFLDCTVCKRAYAESVGNSQQGDLQKNELDRP